MQASSSKDSGVSVMLKQIMERCFGFIEANTRDVFQSDHFLRLPKELLIAIISSNKVTGCKFGGGYLEMGCLLALVSNLILVFGEGYRGCAI